MTKTYTTEELQNLLHQSCWQTDDKDWVTERKANWPEVEDRLLTGGVQRKGINIIKRYFMTGTLPDYVKLWDKDPDPDFKHLGLYFLLWLHPSWDMTVLEPLRDAFLNYPPARSHRDDVLIIISKGVTFATGSGTAIRVINGKENEVVNHSEGHFEEMFDLCIGLGCKDDFPHFLTYPWNQLRTYITFEDLHSIGQWLCLTHELNACNLDMIYQYDQPLEAWYFSVNTHLKYFKGYSQDTTIVIKSLIEKALCRIYQFDTEKEGDTCRTRCVNKLRKILNERKFLSMEFTDILERVRHGDAVYENLWEL